MNNTDIPIKHAMLAWNPVNQYGGDGRIKVIRHPDMNDECKRLKLGFTCGACLVAWGKATKRTLQLNLLIEAVQMALRDGINIKDIHEAFMVIPEYREMLAEDAPTPFGIVT